MAEQKCCESQKEGRYARRERIHDGTCSSQPFYALENALLVQSTVLVETTCWLESACCQHETAQSAEAAWTSMERERK